MAISKDDLLVLQKISNRDDFEDIYNKYYSRSDLAFLREHAYTSFFENVWMLVENRKDIICVHSLYETIADCICREVGEILQKGKKYIFTEKIENSIKRYLTRNIAVISDRLFETEMNNKKEEESDYITNLLNNKDEFIRLINKYPYWAELVKRLLEDSRLFLVELTSRLISDHELIGHTFFGGDIIIEDLFLNVGDKHRGKYVVEVKTTLGNCFYKPRKADTDKLYRLFADSVQRNSDILDMNNPKLIDCEKYYWIKKIQYKPLENKEQKKRYYQRFGQLIAIIYLLNGNDIHNENLISCGEYPIIIDTETILSSRLLLMKSSMPPSIQEKEVMYGFDSVRSSMLLPYVHKYKKQNIDFSPINMVDDKFISDVGKNYNHALRANEIDEVSDYVIKGFSEVYWEVANNVQFYKNILIRSCKNINIRFLNKHTGDYYNIQKLLNNPVCLFDSDYAFAVTSRLFDARKEHVSTEELYEQKELLLNNIPLFEVKCNSRDLEVDNNTIIKKYFAESPIDGLLRKMEALGEDDYHRQKMIVKKSLEMFSSNFMVRELCETIDNGIYTECNTEKTIMNFTDSVVEKIFKRKCINPFSGIMCWMDPVLEGDNETGETRYQFIDITNSIYGGNIGILFSLLGLGKDKYMCHIIKLRHDIEKEIEYLLRVGRGEANIGSYNGLGAYIRYYIYIYRYGFINKEQLFKTTKKLIDYLKSCYNRDQKLDILDGVAGVILTIIELKEILPEKVSFYNDIIFKLRMHLASKLVIRSDEAYVPMENDQSKYYSGFAHGSSGVVLALYKANKELGIKDCRVIKKLISTEREMYNPETRAWYRDSEKNSYSWGWCHGIPGILLSRVEMYKAGYRDERILTEIEELYSIAMDKAFGSNLTFCHGDIGNISICKHVADYMQYDSSKLDKYSIELFPKLLDSVKLHIRGTEATGLMCGLAGIIYFLNQYILKKNNNELVQLLTCI